MSLDQKMAQSCAARWGRHPWFDRVAIFFARQLIVLVSISAIIWYWVITPPVVRPSVIGLAVFGVAVAWPFSVLMEVLFRRPRPFQVFGKPPLAKFWTPTPSFPSAHATIAFAIAAPLFAADPVSGFVFFAFAVLIGTSRVYVGVHYPSDIAAGAVVGSVLSLASQRFAWSVVEFLFRYAMPT